MAKKNLTIDNRHKTIVEPYIRVNMTFEDVLCQYSTFENEVRFKNCVFTEDVIWGDEFKDEAFSNIKADLIFDNCIFKKKALFDGIHCKGHVIFKHCKFEYESDYSLTISNSYVDFGVEFSHCVLSGGINLSAAHINRVGCFFNYVVINNPSAYLCFNSGYFGKQLQFQACSITCRNITFENSSVDETLGSINWVGPFKNTVTILDIISFYINKEWSVENIELYEIVSYYEYWAFGQRYLIILFNDNLPLALINNHLISVEEENNTISNRYGSRIHLVKDTELYNFLQNIGINEDYLSPVGCASCADLSDGFINAVYYNGDLFIDKYEKVDESFNKKDSFEVSACSLGGFILGDEINENSIKVGYHNGVRKIEGLDGFSIRKLAIFCNSIMSDDNDKKIIYRSSHFRIYDWNYFDVADMIDLSSFQVGSQLNIGQTEFQTPLLCLDNIVAKNRINFIDVSIKTRLISSEYVSCKNLTFQNVDLLISNYSDSSLNILIPSKENERGIFLKNSRILDNFIIKDLLIHKVKGECNKSDFFLQTDFMEIGKECLLERISFRNNENRRNKLKISFNYVSAKQFCFNAINWGAICLGTENIQFLDFKIDKLYPNYERIKYLIDNEIIDAKGKIQLLRQIENVLADKYNQEKNARKFWRLRYSLRIKQEHPRTHFFVNRLYKWFLDYGLSSTRLVFLLLCIMLLFDIYVSTIFHVPLCNSIINGLVIFSPVGFDNNIIDPIIIPKPEAFLYSVIVVLHRVLSYILLAIIIASYGGFFRGRYK
jgi:hypothetical protein